MIFKKKPTKRSYDKANQEPLIRASICNGEQVAGFRDLRTGAFQEVMLIRNAGDLAEFKERYGIAGEIAKVY